MKMRSEDHTAAVGPRNGPLDPEACARWARSGLGEKLGPAFMLLGRLLSRRLERALVDAGLGITPAQARVLIVLHFHGPLTQQSLADHTDVDPSTLVSTLDVMERDGMALREPNPQDRRAHLVRLTDLGQSHLPKLFDLWEAVEADLARDLEADEKKALLAVLHELIGRLSAGETIPCG